PVEIPLFDQVLADIGDEQSLQQSLSTFSGHIRRISRILDALSDEITSLVLLDEVGSGTDPAEGSALAIALLQHLADNAQLTMATTHFGEVKALKYEDERFENASVEFDEATLSPTYRLLWGIPGRSNALAIAGRLGLKPEVIERAKTQVGGITEDINQVIAGLEAQRRSQETKAAEAESLLKQAERLYKEVNTKANSLEEREKGLRASQEIAVQKAIAQAKAEIAQVIRRLQQGTPTAQDAQKATNTLQKITEKFTPPPSAKKKIGFIPKVGERIRIPQIGQTAEVIAVPNEDGELNVRFGIMKMTVKLADIESLDGKKPEPLIKEPKNCRTDTNKHKADEKELTDTTPTPSIRTSKNTFDIRGKRVADAEIILDKAIAEGTGVIWIIHGHGTGKLRQGVQEFLRQHPRVSHYEAAPQNEGGTGVTIAHVG
ncbi:MAG: Smr/MutS family protein, partial [Richelia sp.]|nr:Smr/MutS family protein [Richelia sp.]